VLGHQNQTRTRPFTAFAGRRLTLKIYNPAIEFGATLSQLSLLASHFKSTLCEHQKMRLHKPNCNLPVIFFTLKRIIIYELLIRFMSFLRFLSLSLSLPLISLGWFRKLIQFKSNCKKGAATQLEFFSLLLLPFPSPTTYLEN